MLAIKLQRVGKKHQPSYRLVVAEKRSKLIGPPIEDLGAYSTMTKQGSLKNDRISYWIGVGAQPTATVHNLLVKQGVLKAPKIAVKMKKVEPKDAAAGETAKPVAEVKTEVKEASAEPEVKAEAVAEEKPVETEAKAEAVAETENPGEEPKTEEKVVESVVEEKPAGA